MDLLTVAVVGVLAAVAISAVSPRLGVAAPLLLVAVGTVVSLLPFVAAIEIEPEWVLVGILPPLLYSSAVNMPTMDFRRDFGTISMLSVVLVVATSVTLGFVATWLVPGIPLATGIAIGAILSPTDAVATSIVKQAGTSSRVVAVLDGESMLNDASALVLLRSAIVATATAVSLWHVAGDFVYAVVVAVAVGWGVGRLNLMVRAHLAQATSSVAISLVVPFVAYLPAERLGASGLVAAVTAGLVTGHGAARRLSAADRLTQDAVWRTVELLLESAVFLLMGLQLDGVIEQVQAEHGSIGVALRAGLVAIAVVLLVRAVAIAVSLWALRLRADLDDRSRRRLGAVQDWLDGGAPSDGLPAAVGGGGRSRRRAAASLDPDDPRVQERAGQMRRRLARAFADLDYLADQRLGWREGVVLVWAGMRGAVTLAAAQSLPADTPQRSLLVLVAFVVAAGTLLLQGGTLGRLVRGLGLTGHDALDPAELTALRADLRVAAAEALDDPALRRPDGASYSPGTVDRARTALEAFQTVASDGDAPSAAEFRDVRILLIAAQRAELLRLRGVGSYSSASLKQMLDQLDADELSAGLRR